MNDILEHFAELGKTGSLIFIVGATVTLTIHGASKLTEAICERYDDSKTPYRSPQDLTKYSKDR